MKRSLNEQKTYHEDRSLKPATNTDRKPHQSTKPTLSLEGKKTVTEDDQRED